MSETFFKKPIGYSSSSAEEERASFDDSAGPRRLRIAINAITDLTPKYGSRVYLRALAQELAKLPGIDLLLLIGQGQKTFLPPDLQPAAREVAVPTERSYLQFFYQKRIREVLLLEEVNVYHLPNTLPLLYRWMPTVITIHDLVDLRVRKYGVLRTLYRMITNFLAAHIADHIIAVSQCSKRDIAHFLCVPESKITVIHNGVGPSFHVLDRQTCKTYLKSNYCVKGNFLLAPGGLSRNKNVVNLLAAFHLLRQSGRQELLVLLGSKAEPEFKPTQARIAQLGLQENVILPEYVPPEDLPAFYNACSLVLYPSLYEGFGLPVLEAMACGAPIVLANCSSLPEVAGDAALLVDPLDAVGMAHAVRRVLEDEVLREQLIQRGLQRAREFSWRATAERSLAVYRAALATKKEQRAYSRL